MQCLFCQSNIVPFYPENDYSNDRYEDHYCYHEGCRKYKVYYFANRKTHTINNCFIDININNITYRICYFASKLFRIAIQLSELTYQSIIEFELDYPFQKILTPQNIGQKISTYLTFQ